MKNFSLALLCALMSLTQVTHPLHAQQIATTPAIVRAPKTDGERKFAAMIPRIKKADDARDQISLQSLQSFANLARTLSTDAGRDHFVEQVTSLQSKGLMVSDSKEHARWVRELYVKYVFPHAKLKELLRSQSRILEKRNSEITDELVVDLFVDIDLPSTVIKWPPINDKIINEAIDREVSQVLDGVETATGKQLAAFFTGLAGGEVARQVTRDAMKDKNGNVDLVAELFSWVVDAGVSYVVDEFANEFAQTKPMLRKQIDNSVNSLLQGLTGKESKAMNAILSEWIGIQVHQHLAVLNGLYRRCSVDPAWARAAYDAHN